MGAATRLRHRALDPRNAADVLVVQEGALYPALHRLERKGLLSEEWGESETGRQAKYYTLTPKGRAQLRTERKRWQEFSSAVAGALASARSVGIRSGPAES